MLKQALIPIDLTTDWDVHRKAAGIFFGSAGVVLLTGWRLTRLIFGITSTQKLIRILCVIILIICVIVNIILFKSYNTSWSINQELEDQLITKFSIL